VVAPSTSEDGDVCGGGQETPPPRSGSSKAQKNPLALFGAVGGDYDPDMSLHEVEITDQEMEKLQEEFGDLDDTMMSGESGEGEADGEGSFPDGATPVQQENLFAQPHPLRHEDLFNRTEDDGDDDQGFDYCDMQRAPDQGEGQEEGSKCYLDTT
jgi:hypothetical protein